MSRDRGGGGGRAGSLCRARRPLAPFPDPIRRLSRHPPERQDKGP